ncbi:MAG: DUF1611 domain-containing protein [Pseudomonadota bacterium]
MTTENTNAWTPTTCVPATAKWAFSTRRVAQADAVRLSRGYERAEPGMLLLGEITHVGQHKKVQLASGRYSQSYTGDLVVMAVGARYAPDQFEGLAEVSTEGADMIAGGGVVGRVVAAHSRMSAPTRIRPIGLLARSDGGLINLADYALPAASVPEHVTVLGVLGASMNSGKTTAAVSLAHGLAKAGFNVAGVKATGTGAFGDFNAFRDAGIPVRDFTDAGMPTTYRMPMERIEAGFDTLVGTAAGEGAEIVVVEIADGLFQQETASIMAGSRIRHRMDGILFAAPDALGAVGGVTILRQHGIEPFAVSGMVTLSALGQREAAAETGVPMLSRDDLCCGDASYAAVRHLLRAPHPDLAAVA